MFEIPVLGWKKAIRIALPAILLASLGTMSADVSDKKTIFTFSAPVEIPGKALPAGTYVFKLLDSTSNRHIVQVFDKDQKQVFATILAIPDYRDNPSDKTVLLFEERPAGTPPAVKAWFYPGDNYGQEFVYPHKQAVAIAKRTHKNVLSMDDSMAENIKTKSRSAEHPQVQELQRTEVSGVDPSGEPIEMKVVITTKPVE